MSNPPRPSMLLSDIRLAEERYAKLGEYICADALHWLIRAHLPKYLNTVYKEIRSAGSLRLSAQEIGKRKPEIGSAKFITVCLLRLQALGLVYTNDSELVTGLMDRVYRARKVDRVMTGPSTER